MSIHKWWVLCEIFLIGWVEFIYRNFFFTGTQKWSQWLTVDGINYLTVRSWCYERGFSHEGEQSGLISCRDIITFTGWFCYSVAISYNYNIFTCIWNICKSNLKKYNWVKRERENSFATKNVSRVYGNKNVSFEVESTQFETDTPLLIGST